MVAPEIAEHLLIHDRILSSRSMTINLFSLSLLIMFTVKSKHAKQRVCNDMIFEFALTTNVFMSFHLIPIMFACSDALEVHNSSRDVPANDLCLSFVCLWI